MSTPTVNGRWKAGVRDEKGFAFFFGTTGLYEGSSSEAVFALPRMTLRSFSVEEISRLEAMLTFLFEKVPAVRNRASLPAVRCDWNRIPRNPYRELVSRKCPKITNDNKQLRKKRKPLETIIYFNRFVKLF
jgi:hypothetical protein